LFCNSPNYKEKLKEGPMRGFLTILGRIFMSVIFIASGVNKLLDWKNTENGVTKILSDWSQRAADIDALQGMFIQISPYVDILVIVAIAFELIGGLMVLLGFYTRLGALILFLFMIPTTFLFHSFWYYDDPAQKLQLVMFLKNFAIMGGLLYMMAYGSSTKEENTVESNEEY